MPSQNEIERRYKNIRAAMEAERVDALIVCGNQYAGFEGAVRYVSDFEIVHRYVYALIPLSGDPVLRKVGPDDLLLYSLEVTGAAGYWIEFSRALIRGKISPRTQAMSEVYPHAMEAARVRMREGMLASEVHKAAADIFSKAGFSLGHLTGHSIGMTMIEHPAIGANTQIELKENMVLSFHPQVVDQDGQVCLYTGLEARKSA